MFNRFTDRARKLMGLAHQEALRCNHDYIGTEHILLGLVAEGSGVGATVLKKLDIDLKKIRQEVEKLVSTGTTMVTMGQLPFTPRAKRVLELTLEEASNLRHMYLGTEHILLGLIREEEGIAAQVLRNLEVNVDRVRAEVLELLAAEPALEIAPAGAAHPVAIPVDLLVARLLAPEVMQALGFGMIAGNVHGGILAPVHLLAGIAQGRLFAGTQLAACVEKRLATTHPRPQSPGIRVRMTAAATRVLGRAILEAGRAGKTEARVEDLLLALLDDEDGEAAIVLRDAGEDPDALRRKLRDPPPPGNPA